MTAPSAVQALQSAKSLYQLLKESSSNNNNLSALSCRAVLQEMETHLTAAPFFKLDTFVKTLAAAEKTFRRYKRQQQQQATATAATTIHPNQQEWDDLLHTCHQLTQRFQQRLAQGEQADLDDDNDDEHETSHGKDNKDQQGGILPTSTAVYLGRLKRQGKELYKNPPVLPPSSVVIQDQRAPLPTRNDDGFLSFAPGSGKYDKTAVLGFHPNVTPQEILRQGAFGGTYFRSIVSAVTNTKYSATQALSESVPDEWIAGLDRSTMLTSQHYATQVNKFKVKCGGSLGMWESSGWISDADPYGWFQWYCRFYQGRRSSDDARQIARWKGVAGSKGRFRSQLCNKIVAAGATADDVRISPVIRQTLWHWGILINEKVLEMHKNR